MGFYMSDMINDFLDGVPDPEERYNDGFSKGYGSEGLFGSRKALRNREAFRLGFSDGQDQMRDEVSSLFSDDEEEIEEEF